MRSRVSQRSAAPAGSLQAAWLPGPLQRAAAWILHACITCCDLNDHLVTIS